MKRVDGYEAHSGGFYMLGNTVYYPGPDFEPVELGKYKLGTIPLKLQFNRPVVAVALSKCSTVWEWCYALSVNMNGFFGNNSERFLACVVMDDAFKSVTDVVHMDDLIDKDKKDIDIFSNIGWNGVVVAAISYAKTSNKKMAEDKF